MPPRDEKGSRERVLNFILDNEPDFENTVKCWVINSFFDRTKRKEIVAKLAERNMYVLTIPWARRRYVEAKGRDEKILAAIGINKARNLAADHGRFLADFTFVLDGDCFFNQSQWDQVAGMICEDQKKTNLKNYSVACTRSTFEHAMMNDSIMTVAEPMPIFRYDSKVRFDESLPFGKGEKLDFMYRLGHNPESGSHSKMLREDKCKCFGTVHHISGSSYEIENDTKLRISLREKSLDELIRKMDSFEPAVRPPNENWKKISGYFDFQGLYSHFVHDNESGFRMVEVGSWQGASMCYIATEVKNYGKTAELFAVDTWQGSDEEPHKNQIAELGGAENLYRTFLANMHSFGLDDIVKPIRMSSRRASEFFEDESLDIVFIDASHKYKDVMEDIRCWYPKVKFGGTIAGHDYVINNTASQYGVVRAVNEFFHGKNIQIFVADRSWLHVKK